jgi:adenylate cyclase
MSENTAGDNSKPPVDRLAQLWGRVKDHKIAQWTVAYVALAYGIQHAVILTSESLDLPRGVARISMLLLALGLPVVMTLAWYQGERASRRISGPELSIIAILLAIGSMFFYVFVQPSEQAASGAKPAVQQASVAAARAASVSPAGAISIAVLPFANLSADQEQEFFSDGMTDEISGALAKISDLRVVGRASAFQYKKRDADLRAIGQALGATHLIEGSVRKAGNRVRISAELVQSDNGLQIWSENYDRDLTDVFAIQEDIAKAIAVSLRMPLGLKPGENLVNSRTKDESLHEEYLRAKALVRTRTPGNGGRQGLAELTEAAKRLEQVVAREPDFAPAWALLGLAYGYIPLRGLGGGDYERARTIIADVLPKAEAAANRAITIDPKNADGYFTLGFIQHVRAKQILAMESFAKAMALDPTNPDGLHIYSDTLADLGYVKKSLPLRQQLQALEPFVPVYQAITARILGAAGEYDAAFAIFKTTAPGIGGPEIARVLAAKGLYGEAADALQKTTGVPQAVLDAAVQLLRSAPAKADPHTLPDLDPRGALTFVYAYVGAPERVIAPYEQELKIGYVGPGDNVYLWTPALTSVRKTARFKSYMRAVGMVDYWRKNGWPDLCHPVGADDFACD